jgi:hypothetical protein
MTAGFPAAADVLRRDRAAIAADALEAAVAADPELQPASMRPACASCSTTPRS